MKAISIYKKAGVVMLISEKNFMLRNAFYNEKDLLISNAKQL